MSLDVPAMTAAIRTAIARDGVVRAWDGLMVPVLVGIGRKHAAGGDCVEVEHLLTTVVLGRPRSGPSTRSGPASSRVPGWSRPPR